MTSPGIEVQQVRDRHPIEDVVAAAGVDLHRCGRGWMGRCPFHEDSTASLSVAGVPERFHCFGCGAHGDVIDFVQLRYDLPFREAVARLEGHAAATRLTQVIPLRPAPPAVDLPTAGGHAINELAWDHYTRPVAHAFAVSWLRHHRGINIDALEVLDDTAVAGHTGHGWTGLTDRLRADGVSVAELQAMDLAHTSRRGTLIDTLRDRLVLPIRDSRGALTGFVGRDTADDTRAPKYRNPTHTPTFTKATALYTPRPRSRARATVVVEGPLDALAVAALSAAVGRSDQITAVSALGTAVSPDQADLVVARAPKDIVLALDGDTAGIDGTHRWLDALCRERHRPVLLTSLPDGLDPADWLLRHGPDGLTAFDPESPGSALAVRPTAAGMAPRVGLTPRPRDQPVVPFPVRTPTLR